MAGSAGYQKKLKQATAVLGLLRAEAASMWRIIDEEINPSVLRQEISPNAPALRLGPAGMKIADEQFDLAFARRLCGPRDLVRMAIIEPSQLVATCANIARSANEQMVDGNVIKLETSNGRLTGLMLMDYVMRLAADLHGFMAPVEVIDFFEQAELAINEARLERPDDVDNSEFRAQILRQLMSGEDWDTYTRALQIFNCGSDNVRRKLQTYAFGGQAHDDQLADVWTAALQHYIHPMEKRLIEVRETRRIAIFGA